MVDEDRIIKVNIEEEMKNSYRDYSMSRTSGSARATITDKIGRAHV